MMDMDFSLVMPVTDITVTDTGSGLDLEQDLFLSGLLRDLDAFYAVMPRHREGIAPVTVPLLPRH